VIKQQVCHDNNNDEIAFNQGVKRGILVLWQVVICI
jgi:hypothetical protein